MDIGLIWPPTIRLFLNVVMDYKTGLENWKDPPKIMNLITSYFNFWIFVQSLYLHWRGGVLLQQSDDLYFPIIHIIKSQNEFENFEG